MDLRTKHLSGLITNIAALYGVQLCRKLLPFVTLPYLAIVLGASGWGLVAFAQAIGELVAMVVEFGFNLSATREVARKRDRPEELEHVVSGVLTSQVLLGIASVACVLIAAPWLGPLHQHPELLAAALFYGVVQGMSPLWFFQGLEKMRTLAALEVSGKLLAAAGTFLLVKQQSDAPKVMLLIAMAPALSTFVGLMMARSTVRFRLPSLTVLRTTFESAWRLFLYRGGIALYASVNAAVLGLFAPVEIVGYYAFAEKLTKSVFGLLNPIREGLYPRLSHLVAVEPAQAARLAKLGAAASLTAGFCLSAALYLLGPMAVHILMGPSFAPAVDAVRILSLLPVLIALTDSVGLQYLLPYGADHILNKVIGFAGITNLVLGFSYGARRGHTGMAWVAVITETVVCIGLITAANRFHSNFSHSQSSPTC